MRGYEFYLWVYHSISHEWAQRMSEISSWTLEDKIHIHKRAYNILFIIQTSVKKARFIINIKKVISSCVKITCYFHVWRYEVFVRKLTWYFTGVYITKPVICDQWCYCSSQKQYRLIDFQCFVRGLISALLIKFQIPLLCILSMALMVPRKSTTE